ncbi:hypothetical protein MO973_08895 [Paenibacillus sp. TRM 82003]|nr:hypothetical protein [Paenibacillus sp. TRM 82003]
MTTYATRQLLRETIIDELQVLPELLRKAEKTYYRAMNELAEKRERLADAEGELAASGAIPLHAEAARITALRPYTGPLHSEIREAEAEADRRKAEVDYLLRKLENYRVMAKLIISP